MAALFDDDPADRGGPDHTGEASLDDLGRSLLAGPLAEVLHRVVELAALVAPATRGASLTLLEGVRICAPASSSTAARALDDRQAGTGNGPCLDAARGRSVVLADLGSDGPYPGLATTARDHDVRSSTSVGLETPEPLLGSLTLYSGDAPRRDEAAVHRARTLASYAAVALAHASATGSRPGWPTAQSAAPLREALRARALVQTATGVLMAHLRVEADVAGAHLRATGRRDGTTLPEAAAEVLARWRWGGLV